MVRKLTTLSLCIICVICLYSCKSGYVDKGWKKVYITLPYTLLSTDEQLGELTQEQKNSGFESAVLNDDGSVTYTMSRKTYEAFLDDFEKNIEADFKALTDGEMYKSFSKIEHNDDYTEVTFYIDLNEFNNNEEYYMLYAVYKEIGYYQIYSGVEDTEVHSKFTLINKKSGEIYKVVNCPDDLKLNETK